MRRCGQLVFQVCTCYYWIFGDRITDYWIFGDRITDSLLYCFLHWMFCCLFLFYSLTDILQWWQWQDHIDLGTWEPWR